jgi:hypothetical protein
VTGATWTIRKRGPQGRNRPAMKARKIHRPRRFQRRPIARLSQPYTIALQTQESRDPRNPNRETERKPVQRELNTARELLLTNLLLALDA